MLTGLASGLDIFQYEAPIVTIQRGNGWIIDGHFNLVHTINLESFEQILTDLAISIENNVTNKQRKTIVNFHLQQAMDRLKEIVSTKTKSRRSIDWLGSAWKWIAGSPDATDWNQILASQDDIIENNNQQYRINEKLFNVSLEATRRINQLISRFNNIDKETESSSTENDVLNKVLIVKEEVNEIVRACQMARGGIVNSNLLDKGEIDYLLNEVETLPYQNVVEAIEYARPSVLSNGTMLLYILAMPKVKNEKFRLLLARATSLQGKRVKLQHQKLLVNEVETYGITDDCYSINNTTICEMSSMEKLSEEGCLARLLKGGDARCSYEPYGGEVIELIDENTIFISNFAGEIRGGNQSKAINGTYLIQFRNETVYVGNHIFSSRTATNSQILPSVLSNVTMKEFIPNVEYVHELNMENISRLGKLGKDFQISTGIEATILLVLIIACYTIWRKITSDIQLPRIKPVENTDGSMEKPKCPPATYIDLRDADI